MKASGKTISRAPPAAASATALTAIRRHSARSRNAGAFCTIAMRVASIHLVPAPTSISHGPTKPWSVSNLPSAASISFHVSARSRSLIAAII